MAAVHLQLSWCITEHLMWRMRACVYVCVCVRAPRITTTSFFVARGINSHRMNDFLCWILCRPIIHGLFSFLFLSINTQSRSPGAFSPDTHLAWRHENSLNALSCNITHSNKTFLSGWFLYETSQASHSPIAVPMKSVQANYRVVRKSCHLYII